MDDADLIAELKELLSQGSITQEQYDEALAGMGIEGEQVDAPVAPPAVAAAPPAPPEQARASAPPPAPAARCW